MRENSWVLLITKGGQRADGGIRTRSVRITNPVLYLYEHHRQVHMVGVEPRVGVEPTTSSLPRKRST